MRRCKKARPKVAGKLQIVPWNKGLTKDDDSRIVRQAQLKREAMLKSPLTKKLAAHARSFIKNTKPNLGKRFPNRSKRFFVVSEEQKQRMVATRRKNGSYISWSKGLTAKTDSRVVTIRTKWKKSMDAKTDKEKSEISRKAVLTRRKNGSYPEPNPEAHSVHFRRVLSSIVKDRDGFRCQLCGVLEHSSRLNVHHIDHNKKNDFLLNLVTLCIPCHTICHHSKKKRKDVCQLQLENNMRLRFRKIELLELKYYNGLVYNLEVMGNNSYIANGVAVHNCVMLDGKRYPIGKPLDDHIQGMCILIPVMKTPSEMGLNVPPYIEKKAWAFKDREYPTMRQRFDKLNKDEKRKVFGNDSLFNFWWERKKQIDPEQFIVRSKGMVSLMPFKQATTKFSEVLPDKEVFK